MSRRLEWQQVSTQGLNPADSFRNYYIGLQQAAQTTSGLRDTQIKTDDSIIRAHDSVIKNSLDIDKNNFEKQKHADDIQYKYDALDSAERQAAMTAAGKAGDAEIDRGALGLEIRNHFDNGGDEDTALENPMIAEAVRTDKGYKFFTDEVGRYRTGLEKYTDSQIQNITAARDAQLAQYNQDFANSGGAISQEVFDSQVAELNQGYEAKLQEFRNNARSLYGQHRSSMTNRVGGPSAGTAGSNREITVNQYGDTQERIDTNKTRLTNTNDPAEAEELQAAIQEDEQQLTDLEQSKVFTSKDGSKHILDYSQDEKGNITLNNGVSIPSRQATLINDAAVNHDVPFGLVAALTLPYFNNREKLKDETEDDVENSLATGAELTASYIRGTLDKLGSNASLEGVYTDISTQGTSLTKIFNLSNDRNTPINELMKKERFSQSAIDTFEQEFRGRVPFKNEKGEWLTINQWEKSIPKALGFSPLEPEVDVNALQPKQTNETGTPVPGSAKSKMTNVVQKMSDKSQKLKLAGDSTVENIQKAAKLVGQETAAELNTHLNQGDGIPPNMEAAKDLITNTLSSFVMRPKGTGKSISQLTRDEFIGLLGDVKFDNDDQAYTFYTKLVQNPHFEDMPEEDLAIALSFAVAGNYFNSFDEESTDRNITILKGMWDGKNEEYNAVKANIKSVKDNWAKMTAEFDKASDIRAKVEASINGMTTNPKLDPNSTLALRQKVENNAKLRQAINIEQNAIEMYSEAVTKNIEYLATKQAARVATYDNRNRMETENRATNIERGNFIKEFANNYTIEGHIISSNNFPVGQARLMHTGPEPFDPKAYMANQNANMVAGEKVAAKIFDSATKLRIPTKMLRGIKNLDDYNELLRKYGIEEQL